ncbi:MAG: TlpA family protein disulfide reductase [Thermoleophilaceae bacterium]|nr:TlpA family protein disulfide reductase [Thermoleophilaceae bacterium]
MLRLALPLLCGAALLCACASGEPGKSESPSSFAKLQDAPPPLAALYKQPSKLLKGGQDGYEDALRKLRGYPVVVNAWASWCGPCRFEFPFFQRQAAKRGKEVAFLGINSGDNDGDAMRFLDEYPLPFPSYKDPDQKILGRVKAVGLPSTIFYDRKGKLGFLHQGVYADEAKLAADIERYAR